MKHEPVVNLDRRTTGQLNAPQADEQIPLVDKLQNAVLKIQAIAMDLKRLESE